MLLDLGDADGPSALTAGHMKDGIGVLGTGTGLEGAVDHPEEWGSESFVPPGGDFLLYDLGTGDRVIYGERKAGWSHKINKLEMIELLK